MSIPAMWSGEVYTNRESRRKFLNRTMPNKALPERLALRGFRSDVATIAQFCHFLRQAGCVNIRYLGSDPDSIRMVEVLRMLDLTLFRFSPNAAKRLLYDNQQWFLQSSFAFDWAALGAQMGSVQSVQRVIDEAHVEGLENSYKFLHLILPHGPYVLDAQCQPLASRELLMMEQFLAAYHQQAECAMSLVSRLLSKMRELGIYDDALILLTADHGFKPTHNFRTAYAMFQRGRSIAMPILLIKPPRAHQALRRVDNPSTLTDIPLTVMDILDLDEDFPGQNAFETKFPRQRRYYHYAGRKDTDRRYLPPMQEYVIDGPANEISSWRLGRQFAPPE